MHSRFNFRFNTNSSFIYFYKKIHLKFSSYPQLPLKVLQILHENIKLPYNIYFILIQRNEFDGKLPTPKQFMIKINKKTSNKNKAKHGTLLTAFKFCFPL